MFSKLKAAFSLFRKGKAVANPETWRNRARLVNALVGLIGAIVGAAALFGYDFNIPPERIQDLALGIAGLYGFGAWVYRTITREDKGLPSKG